MSIHHQSNVECEFSCSAPWLLAGGWWLGTKVRHVNGCVSWCAQSGGKSKYLCDNYHNNSGCCWARE